MKIKIENHAGNSLRVIEYPATLALFVKLHFCAFGVYRVTKAGAAFNVYTLDGRPAYTISKAGARDALTE